MVTRDGRVGDGGEIRLESTFCKYISIVTATIAATSYARSLREDWIYLVLLWNSLELASSLE